ncbi:hypothetical protein [Streptomyces cinnamoneus]|uniref:hypothetical protein n=1 Tax=Streptomyces cinnamoneus TaxID=53446 RepID=UPI001E601E46|nr:hypothetical protein [Streptomyces cinnamoneus]
MAAIQIPLRIPRVHSFPQLSKVHGKSYGRGKQPAVLHQHRQRPEGLVVGEGLDSLL